MLSSLSEISQVLWFVDMFSLWLYVETQFFQFLSFFFSNIDTTIAVFTMSELTTGTWLSLSKVCDSQ